MFYLNYNIFYFNLDINDYKKQKIEYLKNTAKSLADQVVQTKEDKVLLPMSSYERRIIHAELAQRTDVITESQGEGLDRHIVIKLK
jgi:spoIIIJ-associated protein